MKDSDLTLHGPRGELGQGCTQRMRYRQEGPGRSLDREETVTGATVGRLALEVEEKHGTIS